jgi:hypothetical protein
VRTIDNTGGTTAATCPNGFGVGAEISEPEDFVDTGAADECESTIAVTLIAGDVLAPANGEDADWRDGVSASGVTAAGVFEANDASAVVVGAAEGAGCFTVRGESLGCRIVGVMTGGACDGGGSACNIWETTCPPLCSGSPLSDWLSP